MQTNPDCLFEGQTFDTTKWMQFTSSELASIIGQQHPNGYLEDLQEFQWIFVHIKTQELNLATEYGEEPEDGWSKLYLRFLQEDKQAAIHTPECAGRDAWIKQWITCTEIYPLFVVREDNSYRILDGQHRLAGAFHYKIKSVAIVLGTK